MKVAIVYDRVNKWGGAEQVLLALHELFPDAPLFTSVYSKEHAKWADVFPKIHTSFLQKIPFTKTRHELLPLFMPLAFELFNFDEYDLVISVTSEAAKGILTRGKTKHICYCLTPTRYLWSGYEEYFGGNGKWQMANDKLEGDWRWISPKGTFLRWRLKRVQDDVFVRLSKPAVHYLRNWDKIVAKRPDTIIGISREVQNRIKTYYDRESYLIYPPVDIDKFKVQSSKFKVKERLPRSYFARNDVQSNYYLLVSRLVPYKKVDLAIETCNQLQLPLLVVGTGSQERRLRKMAGPTIQFTGTVLEEELIYYYLHAKAFIFPQEEDFGITAVEAQAHGIPVIAYKKGGALDSVIDRKTGVFFEEQTVESLSNAIHQLQDLRFKNDDLRKNASKFSKEKFKKEFMKVVLETVM